MSRRVVAPLRFKRPRAYRCGDERDPDLSLTTLASNLQGRTEDRLFADAVRVIDELEVNPAAIRVVITASLYSLGGPTLARRSESCLP